MAALTARLLERKNTEFGIEGMVVLTESQGAGHLMRCLCKLDGTTEIGDFTLSVSHSHLTAVYGTQTVWALARQVTLNGL